MSYSGRRRYKSRREKNASTAKKAKAILAAAIFAVIILLYVNRISIKDYLATYFY